MNNKFKEFKCNCGSLWYYRILMPNESNYPTEPCIDCEQSDNYILCIEATNE